ncbi:unnamed protein product [Durusdinium trenchii]|uniref:Glycosyl transferase 48 domain-containing protein n=1 Tax=Durusdinium trenchii TaxID=1381693 RepID=A0ABP0I770_9DINO
MIKSLSQEEWLKRDSLEREKEMLKHFDNLLLSVQSTDPILAWTVNFGLALNETIATTPSDSWQGDDARRQVYFSMVTALRRGHYRREWQEEQKSFQRPLLLPVDLDSRRSETDVAWYMALAETAWATWPTEIKEAQELKSLQTLGAFDGWIGYTTPPSSHLGIIDTNNQAAVMTMFAGDTSKAPKDLSPFPKCLKEESGVGCKYRSNKIKILQFGFSALQPSTEKYLKMEVNAEMQQKLLLEVWNNRIKKKSFQCTLAGVVIDQWADDWDRCAAQRGLQSNPFSQNIGGICDDVANDKRRHLEWYGLSAQYDSFGTHCIDARFLPFGSNVWEGFRFEEAQTAKQLLEDPEFSGFCHRLTPSAYQVTLTALGILLLTVIQCYRTWNLCRRGRSGKNQQQAETELMEAAGQSSRESVATRMSRARRTVADIDVVVTPPSSGLPTSASSASTQELSPHSMSAPCSIAPSSIATEPEESRGRVPLAHVSIAMQIPPQLSGTREQAGSSGKENGCNIVLTLQVVGSRKRNMGQEQASFHLQAHHSAQFRRLWHQVQCEALTLQALGFAEAQCHKLAMANVHARAMEGYLVWLQNRKEPQRDRHGHDKLQSLLGEEDLREPWELWTEVLLLRVLESLSEHGLHAPEFIAALYDQVRFSHETDEVRIANDAEFTIKYDLVLSGVEAIRRNGDPFRGGLNFDDVNELGLEGRIDRMAKTYREAPSLWVVLDLLSNFQQVFVMKVWIFLFAWYAYMSQDSRNGYLFYPTFKRANTLQYIAIGESAGAAVVDVLVIFHGLGQWRLSSLCCAFCKAAGGVEANRCRWLLRRTFSMVVSACGAAAMYRKMHIQDLDMNAKEEDIQELKNGYSPEMKEAIITASIVFGIRVLCYFITTRPDNIPFIKGRAKDKVISGRPSPAMPLDASAPLLATGISQMSSSMANRTRISSLESEDTSAQDQQNAADYRKFAKAEVQILRDFAWLFMLLACFLFELRFIVPLIADFEFGLFCGDTCQIRQTKHFKLITSDCFACVGALGFVWSLVILTAFFDIYYIFYAGTAIFGYCMGEWRGLRNVLSTALRHLDLDSCSEGRVPGLQKPKRREDRQISDGEAMQSIFGVSWRMVWSRIVEALYEDCVISSDQANAMTKAASTVRWHDADGLKKIALPKDEVSRLRFIATRLRSGTPAKESSSAGARYRCISALEVHVRTGAYSNERRVLSDIEDFTVDCNLDSEDLREKLVQALQEDKSVEAKVSFSAFDLPPGSRLLAVHPADGHENSIAGNSEISHKMSIDYRKCLSKEDLIEDLCNVTLPALLVFQRNGASFSEVELNLEPPASVKSISFKTGKDDPGFDPVCWKVEGFVTDETDEAGGRWKQLVFQDKPYLPPTRRETELCVVFDVERWRTETKAGSITLQSFLPVVQERLSFFTASLRSLLGSSDKYSIRPGIDTLLDSHVGNIPSLTQVIPCYNETVILSKKFLRDEDGTNTNLAFIISQFPDEWRFFCDRHSYSVKDMYNAFMGSSGQELSSSLCMEVRMWASMRSQTVARTVVGAMQYQEVIAMLPSVQASRNPHKALEDCVELVLAHQTYGSKAGSEENDRAVRYLLAKYQDRSFYLVFDFDIDKTRSSITSAVQNFVKEKYRYDRPVRYASVLARLRADTKCSEEVPDSRLELIEVLPRCFPLLVGTPGFMTQGKAGNQLGALRFSRGHFLQMMDANMGAFLGEASKVPFILRRFQPHWYDRSTVTARIIGFREFIFTESHGAVGSVMASAEWSFGTICQRFLSGLGARMHYGHPDFLDGFWASNRGSLSKASPTINLSEDIFAGFNVRMRGEASKHVDTLAWEKGRESSFNAAALFYTKVSKGNVGVMRSRDLKILTQNMNVVDNFSFYFASVGFYFNNLLIDISATVYVFLFILLALCSKSLTDVASLDSMLATEWTLSMGTIAMFPRFMELTLEYGPLEGLLRFLPSIPGCMTMFTFINKSIASGLQETMVTGEASYIATGRPNANTHYSWKECYFIHCASHYYPALKVFISYYAYVLVSQAMGFSTLPMMVLLATSSMWLIAPVLFCPQPTLSSLSGDLNEFWQFAIAVPVWTDRFTVGLEQMKSTEELLRTGLRDPRSSLYEFWLLRALDHKRFSCFQRACFLLCETCCLVFLLAVMYSSLIDNYFLVVLLYGIHFVLMEVWRLLNRPTVITLLTTLMWLIVPVLTDVPMLDMLVLLTIAILALRVFRSLALLTAWLLLRPNLDWKQMPERSETERSAKQAAARTMHRYDMVVEYLYVNMMGHQLHLYAAVAILLINLVVQSILVLLDASYGLHSWALLNSRLRSRTCCQRRRGFEP